MSRTWSSFSTRRSVTLKAFIASHGIKNREELVEKLSSMGILPPSEDEIVKAFPPAPKPVAAAPPPPPPPPVKEVTIAAITHENEAAPSRFAARSKPRHGEQPVEDTPGTESRVPSGKSAT